MARIKKNDNTRRHSERGSTLFQPERITAFVSGRSHRFALALILLATIRIAATYTVFTHTSDEPAHLACGMQWLDKGVYYYEAQHPPLSRIFTAIGPYLLGLRSQGTPPQEPLAMLKEGTSILYSSHNYDKVLAWSRAGMLPFFWVACWTVYAWGCRYFSRTIGVVALFVFTFNPIILGHAGLSTTDMALTAFLSAAFLSGLIWVAEPTLKHAVWFGLLTGLMVVSKYSCLVFFPAAVVIALIGYWLTVRPSVRDVLHAAKRCLPTLALAIAIAMVVIWATFRFSFGPAFPGSPSTPAPELFRGIEEVRQHAITGHEGYMMGEVRTTGFWNFYLVAIFAKTPIALLFLFGIGIFLLFRKHPLAKLAWLPLAYSLGVFCVGMASTINIGVRHVLPVYTGFALVAAVAIVRLWESGVASKWNWRALAVLLLWFTASSILAHPDYFPYFNELALGEPENLLVDSDLDWGQDVKRLATRLHELGATEVAFDYFTYINPTEHGLPPVKALDPQGPFEGYNAISITAWKTFQVVTWPDKLKPTERIGKGILLWYMPPEKQQPKQ